MVEGVRFLVVSPLRLLGSENEVKDRLGDLPYKKWRVLLNKHPHYVYTMPLVCFIDENTQR